MRREIGIGVFCATVFVSWSQTLEAAGAFDPLMRREVGSAGHYVPIYKSGAEYVGSSQDRHKDAKDELELWKEAERREVAKNRPNARRIGERDVNERLKILQEDPVLADKEFARIPIGSSLKTGKPGAIRPLIQPIYTELAYLCAAPAAVAIYAAGLGDDQPVLAQYEGATEVNSGDLAAEIISAWELNIGENAHGYAWQNARSPEVLVVAVSTAHTCSLNEMVNQIDIKRTE